MNKIVQIIKEEISLLNEDVDLISSYEEAIKYAKTLSTKSDFIQHVIEIPYFGDVAYKISDQYVENQTSASFKNGKEIIIDDNETDYDINPPKKRNVKTVKITVPNEESLRMFNKSPSTKWVTRLNLEVGENIERVNHYQFSQQKRVFPYFGIKVEEL